MKPTVSTRKWLLYSIITLLLLTECIAGVCLLFTKNIEPIALTNAQHHWLTDNLNDFSVRSSPLVLGDERYTDKNLLYSPVSLYLALSMLYECADLGSPTKKEIETVIQPLQNGVQADMCNALYQNLVHHTNGGNLAMKNNILERKKLSFPASIKKKIVDNYHGNISEITAADLQNLNDLNGTVQFILQNVISFEGRWYEPFEQSALSTDAFTLKNSETVDCTFLNRTYEDLEFIQTAQFSASALTFKNGYEIHFILPNEGISPVELLQQPDTLKLALNYADAESTFEGKVHFKIPKVHFESTMKLNTTLEQLGIHHAFMGGFSALDQPITEPVFLDAVVQTSSFELNEEGARAEVTTEAYWCTAADFPRVQEPELYLYLTRPFLLVLTAPEGYVLFTGVVYNPAEHEKEIK